MSDPRKALPSMGAWQSALRQESGEHEADRLLARAQAHYEQLCTDHSHYSQPALRQHLETLMLPALALYRALLEAGEEQEAALALVERLSFAGMARSVRFLRLLGRLPFFFTLLRLLARPLTERNFPPEGWEIEWVEVSGRRVAFNMHRCFCVDRFQALGVPELTPVMCHLDDLIYQELSPHVRWERTKTLGRGDDCCDFQFYKRRREAR